MFIALLFACVADHIDTADTGGADATACVIVETDDTPARVFVDGEIVAEFHAYAFGEICFVPGQQFAIEVQPEPVPPLP